jgi:hypothetical protein
MTVDLPTVSNLLTIIITTSLTPSAPSTELISSVLESYWAHCPSLLECRVIVVFDGYDRVVPEARLKKGCVTSEQAKHFSLYKENAKKLILEQHFQGNQLITFIQKEADAEYGSPNDSQNSVRYTARQTHDEKVTFIEPSRRLGFGLAVRTALRMTSTPYVWIQQHDWILTSSFPIEPLLQIMRASESEPDQVRLPSRSAHDEVCSICRSDPVPSLEGADFCSQARLQPSRASGDKTHTDATLFLARQAACCFNYPLSE